MECWHERQAVFKENRVVVKLVDGSGNFRKSIVVPTVYCPLNGEYKAFTCKNTERVVDEGVLEVFNSVKYSVGHCYTNTEELVRQLVKQGYDAKSYVGWLFTSGSEFPVHHCWVVLTDEDGTHVLDLADDYTVMLSGQNGKCFEEAKSIEERRELFAEFTRSARLVSNSVRCQPVGVPTNFLLYVGSECAPQMGRQIYKHLMAKFPYHECERNCDANGMNATQKVLADYGLI